jgi:hypothetical protein
MSSEIDKGNHVIDNEILDKIDNKILDRIKKINSLLPNVPTIDFIQLIARGKYPAFKSIITKEKYWQALLYRDYRILREKVVGSYKEYIKILSNGPSRNLIKYYAASDETWKIFIDDGADIRYKKGRALHKATQEGLNKINILSIEDVMDYMYDVNRADGLLYYIGYLSNTQFNKAMEILQILLDKDQRENREFSISYNLFLYGLTYDESNKHIPMIKLLIENIPFNDKQLYDALVKSFTRDPDRNDIFASLTPGEKYIIKNELKDPTYLAKLSEFYNT